MPRTSEMLPSKYLKKEDVGEGVLVTINRIEQSNVAKEGADPEMKWTVGFSELDKPLVLNSTNIHAIELIAKSDNTDDWNGVKVVLYNDPNVSFAGKITGGIRVRAPRIPKNPAAAPVVSPLAEPVSDLPF
jgi:hypothetical protein